MGPELLKWSAGLLGTFVQVVHCTTLVLHIGCSIYSERAKAGVMAPLSARWYGRFSKKNVQDLSLGLEAEAGPGLP